jgi:hypothetical protein
MTPRFFLRLLPLPLALAGSAASAQTAPAAPASFLDALTQGKVSAYSRLRYEHVENSFIAEQADALTVSARLGYTTAAYQGFQAMIEGEGVTPLQNDYYDGTGSNGGAYPTVADPENYEVNQAWLAYTYADTTAKVGRQRIVLDNARFIGDVGFRQNMQTYDAVLLQDKTFQDLTLTYGYLNRINRIFDDSFPQYDWASDSHIVNAAYKGLPIGTLTGYAYLLDFDHDSASAIPHFNSSATYGLSLAGSRPLNDTFTASYRLEYATQTDHGDSPDYRADYYFAELGASTSRYSLSVAYEVLGSDDGLNAFKTPLATLHAHNGWADLFTNTPAAGLTDFFLKGTAKLPQDLTFTAFYHSFGTTEGEEHLGDEIDAQLAYKLTSQVTFTAKYAKFWSATSPFLLPDVEKVWLQAEYSY